MPHAVTLLGRMRIERLVWALDQRLYDLPTKSRVACRREVRQNLLAAAQEAGTGEALRRIGSSQALAREYLSAEYGDRPRHSWIAAGTVGVFLPLILTFITGETANGNEAAILAVNPHATGAFTVPGITFLQSASVYTFSDGQYSVSGGAWTPACYLLMVAIVVVAGRLWRIRPRGRSGEVGRPRSWLAPKNRI
jgi:hypothetical protein